MFYIKWIRTNWFSSSCRKHCPYLTEYRSCSIWQVLSRTRNTQEMDRLSATGRCFSGLRRNDQTSHTHSHGNYVPLSPGLSPKTWWSGWVFLQQLDESELHSLIVQLVNTTGYNLSEWLWMIFVIWYSNQGHCWPPCSSELSTQPYPGLCDTWSPEHLTQQCWDAESVERLKPPVTGWVFHVAMNSLGEVARRNTSYGLELTVMFLPQPPKY